MSYPYKTVLVIGATSGIGLALAEKMIDNGSFVIGVGRRREKLNEFVKKWGSDKVAGEAFDVLDFGGMEGFVKKITEKYPNLDSIVLNSGIQRGIDFTKPQEIDLDMISTEFNTNYLSYVHMLKHFLPFLQARKNETAITFITSGLALIPLPRCPNYCASKAALHHLILALRYQLRDSTVKVIEILPPAVQTELHDAKHQPDIKNGGNIGMPLSEFTEEAWKGLVEGKEQIPVGMSKGPYEESGFETGRQKAFAGMIKRIEGEK